jgi:SpoVK/Ycf46/Vps4 family AAA+-type ATPase
MKDSINFDEIDFVNLVKITKGFSGAEIENIYTKVIELVIESQFNEKEIIITNETFANIIKSCN